jgi:hypothetical protein
VCELEGSALERRIVDELDRLRQQAQFRFLESVDRPLALISARTTTWGFPWIDA